MNNKHFVGKRISTFERYDDIGPITGVVLLLDDENEIPAGDETGYVLEISCPYGTETMAANILASLKGKTYQGFRAENAILSPAAELGDGVTVNGDYFMLAHRTVNFGPGHMSEIEAPGESELENEYPWVSPEKKEFNRKLALTRSEISKTNEAIALKISSDQAESLIKQTLNDITLSVSSTKGVTSISLTGDGVSVKAENLNLSVKAANIEGTLTANQINAQGLHVNAANIDGKLTLSQMASISFEDLTDADDVRGEFGDGLTEYDMKTYINNKLLASPTIAGGVFMDYDQEVSLYLDYDTRNGSYGMILEDASGDEIFSVWDSGIETAALSAKGTAFLTVIGNIIYPQGIWDFSGATVRNID